MKPSCRRNTCSYFPSFLPPRSPGCGSNAGRDLEHLSCERTGRGGHPAPRAASAARVPIPHRSSKARSSAALSVKDIHALQSLLQLVSPRGHLSARRAEPLAWKGTSPEPPGSAVAEQSQILGLPTPSTRVGRPVSRGGWGSLGGGTHQNLGYFLFFLIIYGWLWLLACVFPPSSLAGSPAALTPLYCVAFHLGKETKQKCY